jgi:hypothetical protein
MDASHLRSIPAPLTRNDYPYQAHTPRGRAGEHTHSNRKDEAMRSSPFLLRRMLMACLCLSVAQTTLSQSFSEAPIPHPLPSAQTASLFKGPDRIHVIGIADSIIYRSFDDVYGLNVLYYTAYDGVTFAAPIALPDTGAYMYGPLQARFYSFVFDAVADMQNNIFIVWSKQQVYASDVPPPFLHRPAIRCVLKTATTLENVFAIRGGKNPRTAISPDGSIHWVWEEVAPQSRDSNYVVYTAAVRYRYRTNAGVLSTPQTIDSGFAPQVVIGPRNSVHLVWLSASNSAGASMQLKYCAGSSGIFSTPIVLRENIANPQDSRWPTLPEVAVGVDTSSRVYVGWTEPRAFPWSRFFLLTWNGTTVRVDSSQLYDALPAKFAFAANGELHAAWSRGSLWYSSNINGPLFSEVRTFQSAGNVGTSFLGLTDARTPKLVYLNWSYNSLDYMKDLRIDSVFRGPSPAVLPSQLFIPTRPFVVDNSGNVWVAYGKGTWGGYALWLVQFRDGPNSVDPSVEVPGGFALYQNYPNPFNPTTTIKFQIPSSKLGFGIWNLEFVSMKVFDVLGREVATLVNEVKAPGEYEAILDASHLASGVYYYQLKAGGFVQTRKLVLLR